MQTCEKYSRNNNKVIKHLARGEIEMKKDSISTGLFIAIGFLCVAIVIAVLVPVVRDVIDDADDNRPTIPAVSVISHNPDLRNIVYSHKEVA